MTTTTIETLKARTSEPTPARRVTVIELDPQVDHAPTLSIVIPAYNEASRLPNTLDLVLKRLRAGSMSWEVIVVDDGSRDGTSQIAETFAKTDSRVRVIRQEPNQGKGAAVCLGISRAAGDFILFSDADLSTPIEELDKMLPLVESGRADVAIGSRGFAECPPEITQTPFRKWLGGLWGKLARLLVVNGVRDTQCGFKLFTRKAAKDAFDNLVIRGATFDVEVLLRLAMLDYRVAEVPVRWRHDPDTRITYNLRRSIGTVADLFRIRRHWGIWVHRRIKGPRPT